MNAFEILFGKRKPSANQTVFVYGAYNTCRLTTQEFPVSDFHSLGSLFGHGRVYAYVINRKKEFRDPHYGWAKPR